MQVNKSLDKKVDPNKVKMPNRFYFACPEGLIDVKDIPEYAGLIYVNDHSATVIKNAPVLHKRKFNIKSLLFSKYQWGYINAKDDLDVLKKKYASLEKKFDVMCRGLEKKHKLDEGSVTSMSAFNKLLKS